MDPVDDMLSLLGDPVPDTGPLPISGIPATGPIIEPASDRVGVVTADPAVGRPGAAVRTSGFPRQLVTLPAGLIVEANTGVLGEPVAVDTPTQVIVTLALAANAPAAVPLMTWDGVTYYALNGGQALTAGAWYTLPAIWVPRGAQLNWAMSAATTLGAFAAYGLT